MGIWEHKKGVGCRADGTLGVLTRQGTGQTPTEVPEPPEKTWSPPKVRLVTGGWRLLYAHVRSS